jgi:hypothetical protein
MAQLRRDLDLALEPFSAKVLRQTGMEDLDRNGTTVLQIAGKVDRGHTPAPDFAFQLIAVAQ